MFDAMEEESVLASERAALQGTVGAPLRIEPQPSPRQVGEQELRATIEAELRAAQTKAAADARVALEQELRATLSSELKQESERSRSLMAIEMRPQIEQELRAEIERQVRREHEKPGAEDEGALRKKLEEELRSQITAQLRSEIEQKLRAEQAKPAAGDHAPAKAGLGERATTPPPVTPPPVAAKPATAGKPVTPAPVTPAPVSTAKAFTPSLTPTVVAKPVTPAPVSAAKAFTSSLTPTVVAKPVTPAPVSAAKAFTSSRTPTVVAKPVTPTPVTSAKVFVSSVTPAAVSIAEAIAAPADAAAPPAAKTTTPPPVVAKMTAQPAAPHVEVETAPLSLLTSRGRATVRSPASAVAHPASSRPAASPFVVRSSEPGVAAKAGEAPGGEQSKSEPPTLGPATDGHERARRRARVILSDMSLYHREALLKAARAPDAKLELGTLWRDAVISYNEAVSSDVRSATNYLEEELERHLTQLRSA